MSKFAGGQAGRWRPDRAHGCGQNGQNGWVVKRFNAAETLLKLQKKPFTESFSLVGLGLHNIMHRTYMGATANLMFGKRLWH
jgi:hypothetical protein